MTKYISKFDKFETNLRADARANGRADAEISMDHGDDVADYDGVSECEMFADLCDSHGTWEGASRVASPRDNTRLLDMYRDAYAAAFDAVFVAA